MASLWHNSKIFVRFIFSVVISGSSAFYFIEVIIFVSLEGTPTQTRMGRGGVWRGE